MRGISSDFLASGVSERRTDAFRERMGSLWRGGGGMLDGHGRDTPKYRATAPIPTAFRRRLLRCRTTERIDRVPPSPRPPVAGVTHYRTAGDLLAVTCVPDVRSTPVLSA